MSLDGSLLIDPKVTDCQAAPFEMSDLWQCSLDGALYFVRGRGGGGKGGGSVLCAECIAIEDRRSRCVAQRQIFPTMYFPARMPVSLGARERERERERETKGRLSFH
jgi:hypothetical protein